MDMTIQEVELYGRDVQQAITKGVSRLMEVYKRVSYKSAECGLKRLNKMSMKLKSYTSSGGGWFGRLWTQRLEGLDAGLVEVDELLSGEIQNLENVMQGCDNNVQLLTASKMALSEVLADLEEMRGSFSDRLEMDVALYDAIVKRQKVLNSTFAMVDMELQKSGIVMTQNREVLHQLVEARENVLPMVRIMWMNIMASRATVSALKVQKTLRVALNAIIVNSAKQIEENAREIESEGNSDLVSEHSLDVAAQTLNRACRQIEESRRVIGMRN